MSRMSITPRRLLLGGRGRRRGGPPGGGRALARVVAADEIVRQVQVRLGEQHPLRLVEDHREVFGRGDLADDAAHPLEDLARRLLILGGQVLLVAHVRLFVFLFVFFLFGFFVFVFVV